MRKYKNKEEEKEEETKQADVFNKYCIIKTFEAQELFSTSWFKRKKNHNLLKTHTRNTNRYQ